MLSQRERAEKLRDKEELEAQRDALKEKLVMHRDKGEDMTAEQLEESKRDLSAYAELETRIKGLATEIEATPESNPEIGRNVNKMPNEMDRAKITNASPEYRMAFYRTMQNKGKASDSDRAILDGAMAELRAITDMNGGGVYSGADYLLPQTTLDKIEVLKSSHGRLYNAIAKSNFMGTVRLPVGALHAATNESDGTVSLTYDFTQVEVSQDAIVANVPVKNVLLKNSISALEGFLAREIIKYLGYLLDNAVLNGNPTVDNGSFYGLITTIAADVEANPTHAKTYKAMDWEKIVEVQAAVGEGYDENATWIMRRQTFLTQFKGMMDAEGKPIARMEFVVAPGGRGIKQYFIDGDPVILCSAVPANAFLYGDLDTIALNESLGIMIESDTSPNFKADETVIRGKVYAGSKPVFPLDAFAYYTKTA